MAGSSMNDIKSRIKSVQSTMQITKAMELVATSKLRRAKERAERARPYYEVLGEAIDSIGSASELTSCDWTGGREVKRTLYIVIAGDRGLAGGYNSNVFRLAASLAGEDDLFLPIGKKALEHYRHRAKRLYSQSYEYAQQLSVGRAFSLADTVCSSYKAGEFDRVVLVYTKFVSMISQLPVYEQLLPLEREPSSKSESDPIYDGDPEQILDKIIPQYVGGIITAALAEALASESGARRTAMNSANKNAEEMIGTLMLRYNRARQAVITQEITEIVSGAEAL
ncbi:MAG: ATP synthase F1 subunit gamma [Clostridia bacterium]|nr:ATP synthase F1 subunit gamma [Clostridia bacterium]